MSVGKEDETPIPPHRRSTGSITQWGIIEAWLSADPEHHVFHRMGVHGHEVGAGTQIDFEAGCILWEAVRPNEDPSAAAVRAISRVPK